jgi:acyl-CoA synthetase (AMP-forming)/AMP-acid ligase II
LASTVGTLHPLHWAERNPEKTAWTFQNQQTSYAELASAALRGAQALRKMGLQTGDGVALVAENHPDFLLFFWATQLCGMYFTPISAQYQADEIAHILLDCDARLLVTTPTQAAKINNPPQRLRLDLNQWRDAIAGEPELLIADACEGAEMLYSSGTTGKPKGIRHTVPGAKLGTVSELFKRRLDLHGIDHTAVYLSTAPLYHSAPLRYNGMMHRSGASSVIMPRFDAEQSLQLIESHGITHSQWVPTMFVRLLNLSEGVRRRYDLSSHRYAIHAAAPCPIPIKEEMIRWWGPILFEYYSGTEGNGQTAISSAEWLTHKGSVGRAIFGHVHITDDQGNKLENGHSGQVFFSDGPRFQYYKDPIKTAASYNQHGWSTLGDIGHMDDDGYLFLTDRASHMIISGGVNIYPREVEDVLVTHPSVQDAAVFGIPNAEFGEEVKAAVELTAGATASAEELIAYCRERIAHLKCPRSVDFHSQLPRHQTGKLYKAGLKQPYWQAADR